MLHADLKEHQHIHNATWPFTHSVIKKRFTQSGNLKVRVCTHSWE